MVSLGVFWGCIAVAVPHFENPLVAPLILVALAGGYYFYFKLFRIWGAPSFVWPGRDMFRKSGEQWRAMLSLFRPAFIGRVFRATGWPPWLVGSLLLALLGADLVLMFTVADAGSSCHTRACCIGCRVQQP